MGGEPDSALPLIVVSHDTHMSPRVADVRPYCPQKYLAAFDDFVAASKRAVERTLELMLDQAGAVEESPSSKVYRRRHMLNLSTQGTFDMHARLRDFDREGYAENVMWGSDYPHPEGSWKFPESDDEGSTTRLHLRHTFSGVPPEPARQMLGENAVRLYGLDRAKLTKVAERIGAPTPAEIGTPIETIPDGWSDLPFAVAFKKVDPRSCWPN
jgi:hypothetical protein